MKKTKYECEELLMKHFNLTKYDMSRLWKMFMEFGLTKGKAPHRSGGNHYFLQGITEHMVVEYDCWKDHLTPEVIDNIDRYYPQLKTTNTDYRWT